MAVYKGDPTKDGRIWYFMCYKKDFDGTNKKYKSKKYLRKADAEEAERIFLMKKENLTKHNFGLVAKDFFESLKKSKKESTINSYKAVYRTLIQPYLERLNIDDITILKLRNWYDLIDKKGFKLNYSNKAYNVLKLIFDYAIVNYGLENNPVILLGRFEEPKDKVIEEEKKLRYLTLEEFNKFISVVDNILWKTFFSFLFYTGMRKGEVLALNWNDIDFNTNLITVNKTLFSKVKGKVLITSTKNNLNRKIQMNKVLREQLFEYKKEMMKYTDFSNNWFVFGNSRFLPLVTIDRQKDYYFKLSGVRRITTHEFRHSHVSLLINEYIKSSREKNIKIDTAKFFLMMSGRMGHSVDVMQKTYMHLFPSVQDELVELLDNL